MIRRVRAWFHRGDRVPTQATKLAALARTHYRVTR